MAEIINLEIINVLDQDITKITKKMLEAIVSSQDNQSFFFEIVNIASHNFQGRQESGEKNWYDYIKVFIGVPLSESMLANISEEDRPGEGVVAVPFGLLVDIEEIAYINIRLSIPLDKALVLEGDHRRALMYEWVHSSTTEFLEHLLSSWSSLVIHLPERPFQVDSRLDFAEDAGAWVRELTDAATISIAKMKIELQKRTVLLSALNMSKSIFEGEAYNHQYLASKDSHQVLTKLADQGGGFDLIDLYKFITDQIGWAGVFGGFQGFLKYCQDIVQDKDFLKNHEDLYIWLQSIFIQTAESDLAGEW